MKLSRFETKPLSDKRKLSMTVLPSNLKRIKTHGLQLRKYARRNGRRRKFMRFELRL